MFGWWRTDGLRSANGALIEPMKAAEEVPGLLDDVHLRNWLIESATKVG